MNNPNDIRKKNAYDGLAYSNARNVKIDRKIKIKACRNLS